MSYFLIIRDAHYCWLYTKQSAFSISIPAVLIWPVPGLESMNLVLNLCVIYTWTRNFSRRKASAHRSY